MNTESTGKWFLSTLRPFVWSIMGLLVGAVCLGGISAAMPLVFQRIIDGTLAGKETPGMLWFYGALSVGTALPVTYVLREYLVDQYIQLRRNIVFEQSLRQDVAFYESRDSTVVTTQMSKGISASARLMIVLTDGDIVIDIPLAIFAAVYIGRQSLLALGLLMLFLLIFVVVARSFGGQLHTLEKKYQSIDTELIARQRESVHHVSTVRAHNAGDMLIDHSNHEGKRALLLQNKLTLRSAVFNLLGQGGHRFAEIVVLVIFLPRLRDGTVSMGTCMALLMYAGSVVNPAQFLGTVYATLKQAWANIAPLHELMSVEPMVTESSNPLAMPPVRKSVEFCAVSFSYEKGVQGVLRNFTLSIPAGKTTAIVGRSGVGKTTLARLLTRQYDPSEGLITYDGMDIRHMSFSSISAQIAYLSQDVPIFSVTIAENVSFGRLGTTEEEVVIALKKAAAYFVFDLEDGIHTKIGESGKKLSGGQRQRLAIARLFMGNPSVLILDEATAALDTKTELEVMAAFDTLAAMTAGITTIVIAHRLSTIQHADQIVVMDEGKVSAIGTHAELYKCSPLYQELCGTLVS